MARSGVNKALLNWLQENPEGRVLVEAFDPNFMKMAKLFFNATSDAQRLVAAEDLARIILMRNDLDEMADVRREVRTLELMRTISYPKQSDHSAHTVYVFFMGLWLYSMSPKIRAAIGDRFQWHGNQMVDMIWPWQFAGLLHDIGYVFAEPASATPSSRRLVERFFQPARLTTLLQPRNPSHGADFLDFMSFIRRLKRDAPWEDPKYSGGDFPDQLLNELRRLPWLKEMDLDVDAFDLFQKFKAPITVAADGLEIYAYSVAESGYDGHSRGEVDHAIASTLFMLQWISYWYWLAEATRKQNQVWYERYFCRCDQPGQTSFNLDLSNLTDDVVPILYSVACHNIQATRPEGRRLLPIRLCDDPIAYLLIISDELQKWDRFPSGESHIQNLEDFAAISLVSEDIRLSNGPTPGIRLRCAQNIRDKILRAFDERLHDWSEVVNVS